MESNPDKAKKIRLYVPIIQDFDIKPKCQTQTQAHLQYGIKIQNQYESFSKSPPSMYNQVVKTTIP